MQTGILDKTRLTANILMLVLVGLNIFFSVQYTQNIKEEQKKIDAEQVKTESRLQTSRFMKLFIDKVLGTSGTISFEDRVKLESDVRELGQPELISLWEVFVASSDTDSAQQNAVKLMSTLAGEMVI
jgi:hypothetical protein